MRAGCFEFSVWLNFVVCVSVWFFGSGSASFAGCVFLRFSAFIRVFLRLFPFVPVVLRFFPLLRVFLDLLFCFM